MYQHQQRCVKKILIQNLNYNTKNVDQNDGQNDGQNVDQNVGQNDGQNDTQNLFPTFPLLAACMHCAAIFDFRCYNNIILTQHFL